MSCDEALRANLAPQGDGCVITLLASPRSSANRLELTDDGVLRVRLTAPPVEGAANAALLKLLAGILGIPRGRCTVIAGATHRRKRVAVSGLTVDAAVDALCRAIDRGGA